VTVIVPAEQTPTSDATETNGAGNPCAHLIQRQVTTSGFPQQNTPSTADLQQDMQPDAGNPAPSGELGANGLDVEARVREVLEALGQKPGHDPVTGRFVATNVEAGTTLAHSEGFWAAVADAKRELLDRVRRDAGLNGDAAETMLGLQEAYVEARLLRSSQFVRLVELGGPITTKGKSRALYGAYLAALDREMKLAQIIGIERKQKHVDLARELSRRDA
jgi:hypothetical protein